MSKSLEDALEKRSNQGRPQNHLDHSYSSSASWFSSFTGPRISKFWLNIERVSDELIQVRWNITTSALFLMAEEEFNSFCYDRLGGLGGEAPQLELNARALARAFILV